MAMRIVLMLAAGAVPVLLGIACHICDGDRLARFGPAIGRLVVATRLLIGVWMMFGLCMFLKPDPSSPWITVLGVTGLMFGSLFGMTASLLEWLGSPPKPRAKESRPLASNGPLWDFDLDR